MNREIHDIFADALELPAERRAEFLNRSCRDDVELQRRVDSLLEAHEAAGGFMSSPTAQQPFGDTTTIHPGRGGPRLEPGAMVGRYKLLQSIGEGGFGEVFMAEQTEPVRRKVALKIIKLGMDTKQVIARFEAERQALAMMDHPNIATVFDAGAAEDGRPYFVMELVRGVPITEYCDTNHLPPRDRLDLFLSVCSAVQHAHLKGIIHRDIKPGNVLVTLHDGVPVPKVIDFGIAKATNVELTTRTLFTEFRQMVGTPAYMSPEQAEMSGLDIDTRSDIYSMGVLLYELLTGTTPLATERLLRAGFAEMQRLIREEEPQRPSTKLISLSDEPRTSVRADQLPGESARAEARGSLAEIARHRRTDSAALIRTLRGDLDWMVMKSLEKDRTRRYATAESFAADIRRYLCDEPILARPPGTLYRFGKLLRRNRRAAATLLVVLILAGAAGGSYLMLVMDRRGRAAVQEKLVNDALDRASIALGRATGAPIGRQVEWVEARTAAANVADLLAAGPVDIVTRDRATSFLDRAALLDGDRRLAERIEDAVVFGATHPDRESWLNMERELRGTFADYGIDLDKSSRAHVSATIRASRIPETLADGLELWLGTVGQLNMYGVSLMKREDFDAWVEVLYEADADPVRTQVRKLQHSATPPALGDVDALANSIDLAKVSPRTLSWLAIDFYMAGSPEKGDALYRRALLQYPDDFMLNFDYAYGLIGYKRWEESIRYYMRCTALRPNAGGVWRGYGLALRETGDVTGAIEVLRRSIVAQPDHAPTHADLCETLFQSGDFTTAIDACDAALRLDETLAVAHCWRGRALMRLSRFDDALPALERCHALGSADSTWRHPSAEWVAECRSNLEHPLSPKDDSAREP